MTGDAAKSSNAVKESLRELDGVIRCLHVIPFDEVLTICNTFETSVDTCLTTLDSLQADKAELNQEQKDCKRQVRRLQTSAKELRFSVDKLLEFAFLDEDKYQKMVRHIQEDDHVPVREYVELVKEYWIKTVQCFESFKALYKEAIKIISKTETSIEVQEARARSQKTTTQVVGGTVAGAGIAGGVGIGVATSVLAGIFTFGVGAIVGLSITAVGTAVGGTAVGVGTVYKAVKQLKELETLARGLRQMHEEMKLKKEDIIRLGDIVNDMETGLKHIEENRTTLKRVIELEASTTSTMEAL